MDIITQYKGLRKEIYILFLGRIVTNMGSMVWPMLTMILSQKMGMNATNVALVMILSGVIMMPANILGGKLADKYNKKMVIVYCDMISIIFYIISAFIPLGYLTIVLMMIAAICQSMEYPSYNSLIADLTKTADRERAYSLGYLGANVGLVASPIIAGILFNNYLWLAFLISGLAIACSTVLIFFKIKDITPVEDTTPDAVYQANAEGESLFSILMKNKIVVLYILIMGLYNASYMMYGYLMPLDLGKIHGDNGAVIYGTVSSLNCIIVVFCTPIVTRFFKKVVSPVKTFIGEAFVMSGYVVFLLMLGHIPFYYVAITLFTLGEIFTTVADGPYISSRTPASHRGRINACSGVIQTLLQGVFMISIGQLYDNVGNSFAWSFVICALLIAVIGAIVLIFVDRKKYSNLYTVKE